MLKTTTIRHTAALLMAATLLATIAPAAEAHGRRTRYKGVRQVRVVRHAPHHRVVVRDHSAGPLIAGLVGGFILGTAVSHASPHRVERVVEYRYHDPYDDGWYDSVDHYWECNRYVRHPRVLRVVEVGSGECVRVIRWRDGDWRECDRDWNDDDRRWQRDRDDWDDD
jgi:hypothetical protein